VRGVVTDTVGIALNAFVRVLNHDTLNSEIRTDSLNGNYHRMLAEGTYTFVFSSPDHFSDTVSGVTVNNFQTTWLNVQLVPEDPVPVELVSLTADVFKNDVVLKWQTATEINNAGFEVERCRSISKFEIRNSNFEQIGFVEGEGTTAEIQNYYWKDCNLMPGKYFYRLKQIDYDGTFKYSEVVEAEIDPPIEISLEQNYPNPFNPTTNIIFRIAESEFVSLKVYDVLGNEAATLVNKEKPAGTYKVEFIVGQDSSPDIASGIYFYRLQAGNYVETKKMILLK
jgi:hypothetical protein